MFTVEKIQAAHSKVKSGADFPAYIQDLIKLGVSSYETFVSDGHADYYGADNYTTSSPAKYAAIAIADKYDKTEFAANLKAHQQGKTDYATFIKDAANGGVEKWEVKMDKMTCTYFDKTGKEILTESIPQ